MMKFKNFFFVILLFCLAPLAHAKSFACPFSDYFAVSAPGYNRIINTPIVAGNIDYVQQSDTFFTLSCKDNKKSGAGDVSIDVGMNNNNRCSLTIHDGPYVMNPTITNVHCTGRIKYDGVDHIYGSYNYTLKFS